MALSPRSIHQFQHRTWSSSQRHRRVVHPRQRIRRLETIRFPNVDKWQTYVLISHVLHLCCWLMDLHSRSRLWQERYQVRPNPSRSCSVRGTYTIIYLPALRSSKASNKFPIPGQHTWPISILISRTEQNKILVVYSVLSLISSVISPTLSSTFFSTCTLHTVVAATNPVMTHCYNPSKTCS
jgi:hypothetical protein